jgi:uncharacterized protein YlxP (DUF503 family)
VANDPKSSPTQLAREALNRLDLLSKDVESLQTELEKADLSTLKQRVAVIEEIVVDLKKSKDEFDKFSRQAAVTDDRVAKLEVRAAEADSLREQVAVLKAETVELKKSKEQTDTRVWNVLMIAVGAVLSLLGGVVVQLIAFSIKK